MKVGNIKVCVKRILSHMCWLHGVATGGIFSKPVSREALNPEFGVQYYVDRCLIANSCLVRNIVFLIRFYNHVYSEVGNLVLKL
jgi:hypothetical protein